MVASRRRLSWVLLGILFFSLVAIQGVYVGKAPTLPNVFVDPPETIDPAKGVGSTFTIRVNVSNVVDLWGWQVNMTFNPAVVNTTTASIMEGPFLKSSGYTTQAIAKKVNNTLGTILVGYMLKLFPTPPPQGGGASGSGTLCNITFTVRAEERVTLLRLVKGTKLNRVVSSNNVPIEHTTEDGLFDNRIGNVSPIADFFAEPIIANVSDTIKFNASASYDPDAWLVSYHWDYGDGETEVYMGGPIHNINLTAEATHIYTRAGIFTVTLTVTDNNGATDIATTSVTIKGHDVAITGIKTSHIAVMPGVPVTINITVANNGYPYTETFNVTVYYNDTVIGKQELVDMASLTETKLTFTWNTTDVSLGKYIIKANATVKEDYDPNNDELIDGSVTISLTNIVDYPVVIENLTFHIIVESTSITSSFNFIRADKKISFNVTGKTGTGAFTNVTIPIDLLGGPYTVLFDGILVPEPQETANGTHTFLYFAYVHSSHTVEIYGTTVATPPVAIFTTSTSLAVAGIPVSFNATESYDDGNIEYYHWNFGDDNTTTINEPIITHAYASAGDYTIVLTVEDNVGLTDSTQAAVTITAVHDVAITALTATPNSVRIGQQVTISIAIANEGNFTETFNITVYYDDTAIEPATATDLEPEAFGTVTILWITTGVNPDTYSLKAIAATVTGETETNDNALIVENAVSIQKLDSHLSVSASPDTFTLGTTTTITGTIDPVREGATITIHYKLADEQTWTKTIGNTTANAQGQYTIDWKPDEVGNYEIKASWQGDTTAFPGESTPKPVTVQELPTTTWLYIGAAVIIIAIAAAAFYFLRRKH